MAQPSGRAHRQDADLGNPNLLPIMSVMCILIPLLIYSFTFFEVKVQQISLPKYGASQGGPNDEARGVTVFVGRDKLMLQIQKGRKQPEIKDIPKASFSVCKTSGNSDQKCDECTGTVTDYNIPELNRQLQVLKDSADFAKLDTVSLTAEDDIPWKVISRVIDSIRSRLIDSDKCSGEGDERTCEEVKDYSDKGDKAMCFFTEAAPQVITVEDEEGKKVKQQEWLFEKVVFVLVQQGLM